MDPGTGQSVVVAEGGDKRISRSRTAPFVGGIRQFVSPENYAASFGHQWLIFTRRKVESLVQSLKFCTCKCRVAA